jgi:DNA polymerase kappa
MAGEVSQWKESGLSLPGQLEGGSPDRMNQVIMHNEAVFSPEQKDELVWVDDYKCSLCGIEMPPYFDEERQEHSDFHLAERLQKDESRIDSRTSALRQRLFFILMCVCVHLCAPIYIYIFFFLISDHWTTQ